MGIRSIRRKYRSTTKYSTVLRDQTDRMVQANQKFFERVSEIRQGVPQRFYVLADELAILVADLLPHATRVHAEN